MCGECREECKNPLDRRFHAEPIACAQCGPKLVLIAEGGDSEESDDPIEQARKLLAEGKILTIKGIGGFHRACDA